MSIFTHITVGTNDLARAGAFYDQVLEPFGLKRLMQTERAIAWGADAPQFMVLLPRNGEPATVGNGLTVGFVAPTRAAINEFHRRALALGGQDEGAPGPRPFSPHAYAAYVRDLDGHKICASKHQPE